ncbi:uncharacterized protein [Nicotiana sylvestris]|uniref:uncharacterized protein n=1 Tax=Nicotiana sylvestris TaxID=4096 RepID=UPI00388C8488
MEGLEYEDICVHPDVDLPAGYKVPKFDMFDGKGNPRAHLRSYCDKLVGMGKDETIRMKLFIRSLTGEALDWYTSQDPQKWRSWSVMAQEFMDRFKFNTETNPDRFYLMMLEKKTTESFKEYARRWRAEAARVQPLMGEDEMTTTFIRSQTDATYYKRLISMLGQKFSEVVRMGDVIEEGLKSGKITNLAALQATSKEIQSETIGGARTIVTIEDEKKVVSSAFISHVSTVQVRAPIEVEILPLKARIMALVAQTPSFKTKVVPWDYPFDVRNKGKAKLVVEVVAAGMMRSSWCYVPEEASRGTSSKDNNQKKSVTEAEAEEFWRKMQCSGYTIVDQLKKTPAQISLMSLLMSSDSHRNALVKVLNEAYVPADTTSDHLESMVAQILEAHKISFHEDELPHEGLIHNKALHLTVKCKDKFVSRVLIDNGSALNICPFTTLKALGIDIGKVHESHVNVKAFDGAQRSAIGEIDLALQIGPVEFIIEFQVLDISATYNLLLGRPWIHMAGAVPSTLHQSVKFVWSHQEVVIHGEASNPICPGNSIPVIESVERLDGATFHIEEIVTATRGKEIKLPSVFGCKQIDKNADIVNVTCNETSEQNNKKDLEEYEEDVPPAELTKELEQFENKSKPNLDETELINLGDS